MSNLLLPTLRQPRALSWGWPVKKTPSYATVVQTPASRRGEVRVSLTPVPVWNFEIDLTYIYGDMNQTNSAIQQLLDFYGRMQGASDDWLFPDPYDNLETLQLIGYGDGTTTQFQIGRALAGLSFEPLQNVLPTVVQVNNVTVPAGPQASGNQWYSGLENLLFYSQDFSQTSAWQTFSSITVTPNSTTAPDGTTTANKLARLGSSGSYGIGQDIFGPVPGDSLTLSAYFLQGTAGVKAHVAIIFLNSLGTEISRVSGASTVLTGSWQRLAVTGTVPLGTVQVQSNLYVDNTTSVGDFVYGWGAQLERNPTAAPSSYTATTNSGATPRGLLTFAIAPALGLPITVTFSYYYRCRFLDDEWNDLQEFLYQIWELKSLKFRSILL